MRQNAPREELAGERIWLRKHELAHAPAIFRVIDRDRLHLGRFLPWVVGIHSLAHQEDFVLLAHEQWEQRRIFDYGIFLREGDAFVGSVGAHHIDWQSGRCELGYWIASSYEGQGLVSEAVSVFEEELFVLGFRHLEIRCDPENLRSAAVPRRCGYRLEKLVRERPVRGQGGSNMMVWVKDFGVRPLW